ncbi:MAG TPA: hypothetical protein VGG33_02630 [Polyangia bacterium]
MKEIKVFAGVSFSFFFAFAAAATGLVSCGDDKKVSESEAREVCVQGCNKTVECTPEAAGFLAQCTMGCNAPSSNPSDPSTTCENAGEILAYIKGCLAQSCAEFAPCVAAQPACRRPGGSTGAGGTTGTPGAGGTTGNPTLPGSGGRTGTADAGTPPGGDAGSTAGCEDCVRAQTCYEALIADAGVPGGGGGTQNYGQLCAMAMGPARDQVIQVCKAAVATICR